jgi:Fumarylacetoacetase N-terminal
MSWIEVAPTSHFPIQNLPFGIFSTVAQPWKRAGIAIGDFVLDVHALSLHSTYLDGLGNHFMFYQCMLLLLNPSGRLCACKYGLPLRLIESGERTTGCVAYGSGPTDGLARLSPSNLLIMQDFPRLFLVSQL